jgi:hypothetical protein
MEILTALGRQLSKDLSSIHAFFRSDVLAFHHSPNLLDQRVVDCSDSSLHPDHNHLRSQLACLLSVAERLP